ncbi:PEP-CTERM sorting domain-containing protein [Desulfobacula sp.]|uniref:PEP-CTERM sorting domain-containing protein n=1 Tax=Desulfobacula sp. TaxID=2593537 RepID=UPI00261C3807|nr:PEP-CTERM sorting domain-containing protein [Desulfobacula sp.]
MRNKFVVGFLTGLLMLSSICMASASTISVANHSFESPDISNLDSYVGVLPNIWVTYLDDWSSAVGTRVGTYQPGVTGKYDSIPDGDQVAFTWAPSITQILTDTVAADTSYTLSAYVGWRRDTITPNFSIELLGNGTNVLASTTAASSSATMVEGKFTEVSFTWSSTSGTLNQTLGIRLDNLNTSDTLGPVEFDLISLEAITTSKGPGPGAAVPEPTTMLLLGFGLLGLAGVGRRKK